MNSGAASGSLPPPLSAPKLSWLIRTLFLPSNWARSFTAYEIKPPNCPLAWLTVVNIRCTFAKFSCRLNRQHWYIHIYMPIFCSSIHESHYVGKASEVTPCRQSKPNQEAMNFSCDLSIRYILAICRYLGCGSNPTNRSRLGAGARCHLYRSVDAYGIGQSWLSLHEPECSRHDDIVRVNAHGHQKEVILRSTVLIMKSRPTFLAITFNMP